MERKGWQEQLPCAQNVSGSAHTCTERVGQLDHSKDRCATAERLPLLMTGGAQDSYQTASRQNLHRYQRDGAHWPACRVPKLGILLRPVTGFPDKRFSVSNPVLRHRPGQCPTFALNVPGAGLLKRTYSISSDPNGRSYRISVKREARPGTPLGLASNWLHCPRPQRNGAHLLRGSKRRRRGRARLRRMGFISTDWLGRNTPISDATYYPGLSLQPATVLARLCARLSPQGGAASAHPLRVLRPR